MRAEWLMYRYSRKNSISIGIDICLNVIFFNLLKLDSTAAELQITSLNPKMGIIIPDHSGTNFIILIICGTILDAYPT